jgi:hypothetical protein
MFRACREGHRGLVSVLSPNVVRVDEREHYGRPCDDFNGRESCAGLAYCSYDERLGSAENDTCNETRGNGNGEPALDAIVYMDCTKESTVTFVGVICGKRKRGPSRRF